MLETQRQAALDPGLRGVEPVQPQVRLGETDARLALQAAPAAGRGDMQRVQIVRQRLRVLAEDAVDGAEPGA